MLNILGGGPAGLAAAFYARKAGMQLRVYEAGAEVGGNCRTLRLGPFLFDTGAHRFHDRDPEVTEEVRRLLGDELIRVHAPSQIFWEGRFVDFPLSPYDLLTRLDAPTLLRIARDKLRATLRPRRTPESFRELALDAYGESLAEMFLLGYSEKLWGAPTGRLSTRVAGQRLKGLDVRSFLIEALLGKQRKTTHLDGSFYYPRHGIGMIFERVEQAVGREAISLGTRVTRIAHEGGRVRSVTLDGEAEVEAGTVISTLPLTRTLQMLDPAPPAELQELARSMRYRHLVLAVLCLDRPRFTPNASVYFPSPELPFTRIYESKNRSPEMAPAGQTAIVVEIPCAMGDEHWTMEAPELQRRVAGSLEALGLLRPAEVLGFERYRVPFAYPVLEVGFEEKAERILGYLQRFENLRLLGRSAQFQYSHIHDMFRMGRETIRALRATTR